MTEKSPHTPKAAARAFHDEEVRFAGRFSGTLFATIIQMYRKYRWRIATLCVVGFLGRILLFSNANLIGKWADALLHPTGATDPNHFFALLCGVTLLGSALTLTFRIGISRLSARAVSQLYDEVTYRTSRYPVSFFDRTPAGRILTRFSSDYGNLFRILGGPVAEFLGIIFDLIAMTTLTLAASPLYAIPLGLVCVSNLLIYRRKRESLRKQRRAFARSRSPSVAHFAETTQGAPTIRAYSGEALFEERFLRLNSEYLRERTRLVGRVSIFTTQITTSTASLILLTGLLGIVAAKLGLPGVTPGSLGVAFTFVALSSNSLQSLFEWISQFEEALTALERLDHYLRLPLEEGLSLPPAARFATGHAREEFAKPTQKLTPEPARALEVRELNFRYAPELPWVLNQLSFALKPGETLGVIGRTGSGKSSLIQALFGLYPVEGGTILIDDVDRRQMDIRDFRREIALIPQEPALFRGPLLDNLDLRLQLPRERVEASLRDVGLDLALDYQIEERGRNLSAGERQLLCIARAVLQDAPVVLMDEATSAIDPYSEALLVSALERFFRGRTQIKIAHRLSTIESCDRVLWLDRGRVVMLDGADAVLRKYAQT